MLELIVWDVQHGSAIYVKTPDGRHVAIDLGASGKNGSVFSPLQTLRYSHGLQKLDALVITHPHRDHLDDIFNLSDVSPSVIHTPWHLTEHEIRAGNRAEDLEHVDYYLALRNSCSFTVPIEKQIVRAENSKSAGFQVFGATKASRKNLNDHSLVVVVSYAGLKIMIPGDNEPASWRELLENPAFRSAIWGTDVLVASHHGRESGYCAELFEAIGEQPKLVVISDGGFCDTSATARYCAKVKGWTVFDPYGASEKRYCLTTRKDGHITIRCGWNSANVGAQNFLNVTTAKSFQSNVFSALAALGYGSGPLRS